MYILTSDGKSIIDSAFVERFCTVEKPDAVLIIASYSENRAVTIGKYADRYEAKAALEELMDNLAHSEVYAMPDSRLFHGETWKRDSRTVRKGGS